MKNVHKFLAALVASASASFAAGPFLSIGDDVTVSLSAFAAARYEDNVTLTNEGELDDFVFQFVPGVEVNYGSQAAPSYIRFAFSEVLNRYADYSELDMDLSNFELDAVFRRAKYTLEINGSFNQYSSNSGINVNSSDPAGATLRRDITIGGVNGSYNLSQKTKIYLGFTYRDTDYKESYRGLYYTDLTEYIVPLTFAYEVSPKLDATLGVQWRRNDPAENSRNISYSNDLTYSVGLRGELSPKLDGFANIGFTTRYAHAGDDRTMLTFGLGVNYFYSPKTFFTLSAKNDFGNRAWDGGDQKVFSIGLRAQTDFTLNIRGSAKVTYYRTNYCNYYGRKDNYIDASLALSYLFNENTSISISYMLRNNDSDSTHQLDWGYTANIGAISFSTKY